MPSSINIPNRTGTAIVSLMLAVIVLSGLACGRDLPFDPIGARGPGMAGATTALWDDPTAIYHNPASLVWQTLSTGGGFQPYSWRYPAGAWWFHFYNKQTDYNIPAALALQGWHEFRGLDHYQNIQMGLPIAYGFHPKAPAAIHIKMATEKQPSGKWIFGVPIDIGFLGKTYRGATLGLVARNLVIGGNRFSTLPRRFDYGASYNLGIGIVSSSVFLDDWYDVNDARDNWRVGIEWIPSAAYRVRTGYAEVQSREIYTGGLGLRSPNGPFEFSYSLVYDKSADDWYHFIQYSYVLMKQRLPWIPKNAVQMP
ncbi:hypothetical protein K8I28_05825 [bacterium]|nr:hypothetical protein [bacterium]